MTEHEITTFPFVTRDQLKFGKQASFSLIVRVLMTDTSPIVVRGFTIHGSFTFQITPTTANVEQEFALGVTDIPIAVSVGYRDIQTDADTGWIMVFLGIHTNRSSLLVQGQITSLHNISWPMTQSPNPLQAHGQITKIIPAEPANGQEWTVTVPTAQVWEVLGVRFQLEPETDVADRTVGIVFDQANQPQIVRLSGTTQQVTDLIDYSCVVGGTTQVVTADQHHEIAIPAGIFVVDGDEIFSRTLNLQSVDNFLAISILVRRWYQHS